ncbi:MAG: DsbA family protein, partial [Agromyces sp.]
MTNTISVDIWSDIACPWCFIGKREFESGAAKFTAATGTDVQVTYHSFELAPENPIDIPESSAEYVAKRKGVAPAVVDRMLQQVTDRAAAVGLAYRFDLVQNTNTRKAHELLHLARQHGVQAAVKEALMAAHFEQGGHVG